MSRCCTKFGNEENSFIQEVVHFNPEATELGLVDDIYNEIVSL